MILGFGAVAAAFAGFVYITNNRAECRRFKRHHPGVSVALILFAGYLLVYLMGSVIVFLFGIAMPLLGETLIHTGDFIALWP